MANLSEKLLVKWNNVTVGHLYQPLKSDIVRFQYSPDWLAGNYPAISLSLPLKEEVFSETETKNFFTNLTPEGQSSLNFEIYKKIQSTNVFGFLRKFGRDCAGALSIYDPEETVQNQINEYIDITDLISNNLSKPEHKQLPLLVLTNSQLSIAGAQDKLPIFFKDNRIYVPTKDSDLPTSHIIKPDNKIFKNMQYNEVYCMQLAKALGFNVPESQLLSIDDKKLFLIQRYDRTMNGNNNILRIHQEDFCQALGYSRDNKYQEDGGPGIFECCNLLLNKKIVDNENAKNQFIKIVLFNFIVGNCDAHAKNYSLLYHSQGYDIHNISIKLAPFYDLVSTLVYPSLGKYMAMSFGKSYEHGLIKLTSYEKLIEDLRVSKDYFISEAEKLTASINETAPFIANKLINLYGNNVMFHDIPKVINENINLLMRQIHLMDKPEIKPDSGNTPRM